MSTLRRQLVRIPALLLAALLAILSLSFAPSASAAVVPSVSASEIPLAGGTVTVTGSGFSTSPGIYLALGEQGLAGLYEGFGLGKISMADTVFLAPGQVDAVTDRGRTAPMNADGSFSVKIQVPAKAATAWAVYTSKAHGQGMSDKSQNTVTNLNYAAPVPAPAPSTKAPEVAPRAATPSVSASEIPLAGGTVTVTGSGFSTSPGIYLALGEQGLAGLYEGFGIGKITMANTVFLAPGLSDGSTAQGRTAPMNADGSFSVKIQVPAKAATAWAVYTSKAHGQGMSDKSQNTVTNLKYTTATTTPKPTPTPQPNVTPRPSTPAKPVVRPEVKTPAVAPSAQEPKAAAACTVRQIASGNLQWGLKSSFRSYIRSGIAKGNWTLDAASYNGNAFVFNASSGVYDPASKTGNYAFSGSVHFTGHGGVLDLQLSKLRISQTSATTGVLIADVLSSDMSGKKSQHAGVEFATLNLSGLAASNDSLRAAAAPATLTAAGATAFAGFYSAGTVLDPVSLSVQLGAAADCKALGIDPAANPGGASVAGALANTGVDGLGVIGGSAALLLLLGALAVAATRRRASH
ncbi:HtaA domain-containing protein [Psychromicrobium sp. YIM B11713]|uniref:HtaA domain-containing protein n=1 Tax=Psychromicrobium sp. YIM B11713 TaxID=3145233 RepID=UPI00374F1FD6